MADEAIEPGKNEPEDKNIRIKADTYERLKGIGLKESFNDIIAQLLDSYDRARRTRIIDENDMQHTVDLPRGKETKKATLDLCRRILGLGGDVNFQLDRSPRNDRLCEWRADLITFFKGDTRLCMIEVHAIGSWAHLRIPSERTDGLYAGWKSAPLAGINISDIDSQIETLKEIYTAIVSSR